MHLNSSFYNQRDLSRNATRHCTSFLNMKLICKCVMFLVKSCKFSSIIASTFKYFLFDLIYFKIKNDMYL